MAYERKPGDVGLFKNDKRGNERAPDWKGYVVAHRDIKAGETLDLAMWERKGLLSGKISDVRQKSQASPAQSLDDEIPL